MVITDEVAALIEGGTASWMATSDREQRPTAARVMGARLAADRKQVALFAPIGQAGNRTLANLALGSQVAVFFCKVTNYRAVQLKGTVVAHRPATDEDKPTCERYFASWVEECAKVGLARDMTAALVYWPSLRIDLVPFSLFEQTPGLRAGVAL